MCGGASDPALAARTELLLTLVGRQRDASADTVGRAASRRRGGWATAGGIATAGAQRHRLQAEGECRRLGLLLDRRRWRRVRAPGVWAPSQPERGQRARLSRLHRAGGGVAEPRQAQVHARRGLSRVRARAQRHRHRRGGGEGRRGSGRASRRDLAQAVLQTRSTAASATRLQPATPACLHLPLCPPHTASGAAGSQTTRATRRAKHTFLHRRRRAASRTSRTQTQTQSQCSE
mmetsp:Transcript_31270/g.79873  ORF Transcript_31270/g.79873 Transcript_31270/m.79873 type:complete len:233 (-) Transcript_31270:79-777(-)